MENNNKNGKLQGNLYLAIMLPLFILANLTKIFLSISTGFFPTSLKTLGIVILISFPVISFMSCSIRIFLLWNRLNTFAGIRTKTYFLAISK